MRKGVSDIPLVIRGSPQRRKRHGEAGRRRRVGESPAEFVQCHLLCSNRRAMSEELKAEAASAACRCMR